MTLVCLSFDFDAMSLWINNYKATTPTPLSRGEYGARVGVPRILELLARHGTPATFFVPGHTADTFPESVRAIAAAGHEIGAHNYLHETPVGLTRDQEIAILERSERTLERVGGSRPIGYRSPAWDLSPNTLALLSERGYLYDSSLMADDFTPYRPRIADEVAEDGSVRFGRPAALIELPVAWELDDYPHFHFGPRNQGLRLASDVAKQWQAEFEYCHDHVKNGVFTLTMHPQIIGRGPRIAALDGLIAAMKSRSGVVFATMAEAARRFADR
jgi:peptidoglycan-N-acetylglucosamine deacetylase